MIEINGIYKNFGAKQALRDVSFNVAEGEIMGFLGPNGAGKTTTMNILTGYLSATAGTAWTCWKSRSSPSRRSAFCPSSRRCIWI